MEEEATRIQQERLTAEEENRTLRETVFESQGRARAAEAALKRVQAEAADRDKQLRIMTDQNAELLRLLEQEEAQTARLSAANEVRTRWRWGELFVGNKSTLRACIDTDTDTNRLVLIRPSIFIPRFRCFSVPWVTEKSIALHACGTSKRRFKTATPDILHDDRLVGPGSFSIFATYAAINQ